MKESKRTHIDEMRAARTTANAVFMGFVENYDKYCSHVFCFYEGEDGKYYNQRIKQEIKSPIIPYCVGGKQETLKIWKKITSDENYSSVSKMFFIDRDMDEPPQDLNSDLYITPCYSIENLYVNLDSFQNIIEDEFFINKTHQDFKKCIDLFNSLYSEFCNEMIEFNALVLIRKNKKLCNGRGSLASIKTNQLLSISLEGIVKGSKYEAHINNLKTSLNASDEEIKQAISIVAKSNRGLDFRGKNQLEFLMKLINLLKEAHGKGYFTSKHRKPRINIDSNCLSTLSQYASTPSCLVDFINCHEV